MNRDPKRGAKLNVWRRGPEETIKRERYKRGREDRGNPMTFLPGPTPGSDQAPSGSTNTSRRATGFPRRRAVWTSPNARAKPARLNPPA